MSYDIRYCVETVCENNDGDWFAVIGEPGRCSRPTYNYRDMFVACMGWDYHQGEYYPVAEVLPKLRRGLRELTEHPEEYRQYEPENGWGTLGGAIECLTEWVGELTPYEELPEGDRWRYLDSPLYMWPVEALWWRW